MEILVQFGKKVYPKGKTRVYIEKHKDKTKWGDSVGEEEKRRKNFSRHTAILVAQALTYLLIITFIFANEKFNLIGIFQRANTTYGSSTAYLAACLIGIVGTISLWLTWYYAYKSRSIRDMLVVCAWTHRVKSRGKWVSLEEFLSEKLGYVVSHGISESKLLEMRQEVDRDWRKFQLDSSHPQKLLKPRSETSEKPEDRDFKES